MKRHGLVWVISVVLVCAFGANGFGFSGGSGTAGDPYQIATAADLVQVASFPTLYYVLMNDIDLQGASFSGKVAANTFAGNFNGNGYSVLNYSVTDAGGFFRTVNGTVRNLSLINGIYNSTNSCGGLAYQTGMGAVVENCYVDCTITSTNTHLGGLIGINYGTINRCGVVASIIESGTSNYSNIGGLVGHNYGSITDCYATGQLTGETIVGGFVGYNTADGEITNCYCSVVITNPEWGNVCGFSGYEQQGTLTDCFWDTDAAVPLTVGANPAAGLTGLNTAGMKTQASFVNWDFVGDGGDDTWTMPTGGMPLLTWQANGRYCITPPAFDANGDCLINLVDFAAFAQQWLTCGYANQGLCP